MTSACLLGCGMELDGRWCCHDAKSMLFPPKKRHQATSYGDSHVITSSMKCPKLPKCPAQWGKCERLWKPHLYITGKKLKKRHNQIDWVVPSRNGSVLLSGHVATAELPRYGCLQPISQPYFAPPVPASRVIPCHLFLGTTAMNQQFALPSVLWSGPNTILYILYIYSILWVISQTAVVSHCGGSFTLLHPRLKPNW